MNGHCLCEAVSFTSPESKDIGVCHCGFCRRWSGGPFFGVHCGPSVEFRGTDNITVYASSTWAERAFCKRCGTHLYYKLLMTGDYFVPAGAFESEDFHLINQVYIDNKPGYYALANQTSTMTEQQVLKLFGVAADPAK